MNPVWGALPVQMRRHAQPACKHDSGRGDAQVGPGERVGDQQREGGAVLDIRGQVVAGVPLGWVSGVGEAGGGAVAGQPPGRGVLQAPAGKLRGCRSVKSAVQRIT